MFGKIVYCGREWCPRCGQDDSVSHRRETNRKRDFVFGLWKMGTEKLFIYENEKRGTVKINGGGLGYVVFTIPKQIRDSFKTRDALSSAQKAVHEIMKKYSDVGMSRWHWFGDGKITEGEMDLGEYHPHLNVFIGGGFIAPHVLNQIKCEWLGWLEQYTEQMIPALSVHYQFATSREKIQHLLRYIMRPTFKKLAGNEWLAKIMYRFKNVRTWGGATLLNLCRDKGRRAFQEWIADENGNGTEPDRERLDLMLLSDGLCPEDLTELQFIKSETIENINEKYIVQELTEKLMRRGQMKTVGTGFLILKRKPSVEVRGGGSESDLGILKTELLIAKTDEKDDERVRSLRIEIERRVFATGGV